MPEHDPTLGDAQCHRIKNVFGTEDDVLLDAIRGAIERSRAALRLDSEKRALGNRYESLTPEREVMALVVSGLLNKQVSGELGMSEITVKAAPRPGDAQDTG